MEEKEKEEPVAQSQLDDTVSYKKLYDELLEKSNKDKETILRLTKERDEANSTLVTLGSKKNDEPSEFEKVFGGLKIWLLNH